MITRLRLAPSAPISEPEERVPYTTIQYNNAAYMLQTTPGPFRHTEGYIQHIMEQSKLPAPLARTILYDILENDFQPNDRELQS